MKRFSLTKTCLVAAPCAVVTTASAELATFTFTLDSYASEARFAIFAGSSGNYSSWVSNALVYSGPYYDSPLRGSSLFVNRSFDINYSGSGPYWSSGTFTATLDLPAGDYTMVLYDTYGDGWTGGGVSFSDNAVGDSFVMEGQEVSGQFSVVPAPASLALLGLAGLARRRRD